jgi:hypothetical protein
MEQQEYLLEQVNMLVQRLERIYVDSIWARRSSGHRGNLLKWVEQLETYQKTNQALTIKERDQLNILIQTGYKILEKAAQEQFR